MKGLKEGDYTTSLKKFHCQINLQMLLTVYPHHTQEKGNGEVNYGSLTLEYCVAAKMLASTLRLCKMMIKPKKIRKQLEYTVTYLIKAILVKLTSS